MASVRYAWLALALAALVCFAAACNKPEPPDSKTATMPAAGDGAEDSAASGDEAAGAGEDAVGGDVDSVDVQGAADAAAQYLDELEVNFTFFRADFNANPDATLSLLRFAFDARVTRSEEVEAEVTLDDPREAVKAELDLHHARLEVYPIVSRTREMGEGAQGEFGLRFDGSYQVKIFLPNGELAGVFGVSADGELMTAPPDEQPAGFSVRSRHRADDYGPRRYQVFRTPASGAEAVVLFSVSFDRGGFQTHRVVDPNGNVYEYRFPEGQLALGFGEHAVGEAPAKRRDPNKDREDR